MGLRAGPVAALGLNHKRGESVLGKESNKKKSKCKGSMTHAQYTHARTYLICLNAADFAVTKLAAKLVSFDSLTKVWARERENLTAGPSVAQFRGCA